MTIRGSEMDDLERFVLEGDARIVDAWWAKRGMGHKCDCITISKYCLVHCPTHYTTDRALSHVIEGRVLEQGEDVWDQYCMALRVSAGGDSQKYYYCVSAALRASNRQRILAAARAMNLNPPSQAVTPA